MAGNSSTIYDVAERAGVSITTVSNVLNRPGRVGAETRQRVLTVIEELGYTPKAAAVSHARKGVGRIGVLAPFTSYASYRDRLVGVLNATRDRGVEVVVFDHESAAETASPLLRSLPATGRLDGLIVMGLPLKDEMVKGLQQRNLPTVLVDSYHRNLSTVDVDDERGGFLIGQHLIAQGHERFAYVSERQRSTAFTSQGQKRMRGLRKALADAGLSERSLRHVVTTHDLAGGRHTATDILTWRKRPTAVVGHFDILAAGLLSGFRTAELRIPEDIAVVGYDDSELAESLQLTTVRQPFAETGEVACKLLLDQLYGDARGVHHATLPAELVVRNTS
ncbi:LacI family DNA-binding transcriptional regulator [Streptomyces sp. NPDC057718]|uniref:LacI family DNA-binding transcriptional regulator n=1 Tax=Streptomyces sp. NPDC057718 TaxID=3346225 RepID=UPI003691B9D0